MLSRMTTPASDANLAACTGTWGLLFPSSIDMGNLLPIALVILSSCFPFVGGLGLLGARCEGPTEWNLHWIKCFMLLQISKREVISDCRKKIACLQSLQSVHLYSVQHLQNLKSMCKDRWTKRGGELGLFQFLKRSKATLTYAMLVRHQFKNRITKLPTQAKRDKTRSKA